MWMALAMMVKTRLWLGCEVSAQRDMTLIRWLSERGRRCAPHRPLLCCTDGVCSYIRGRARPCAILYIQAWAEGPGFVRGAMS